MELHYGELAAEPEPPVAVRSSALGEDSEEATFAGQQETFLWVRGVDGVCDAVRDCWVSLYSPEALSYRARLGGDEAAAMGVTIQLMADARISGVMFTCNPVSGDPSMVAINASWGLGLAVVGGEVTPDDYLVSKVTREVVRRTIAAKDVEYVPGEGGRGAVRVDVPAERRDAPCLDDERLAELAAVARRVEAPLRRPPGHRVGDRARWRAVHRAVAAGHGRGQAGRGGGRFGHLAGDEQVRRGEVLSDAHRRRCAGHFAAY